MQQLLFYENINTHRAYYTKYSNNTTASNNKYPQVCAGLQLHYYCMTNQPYCSKPICSVHSAEQQFVVNSI